MQSDCHIHMLLSGGDWKAAIARHASVPDIVWIRSILSRYREQGYTYLRDGGDRFGAATTARKLAPEYGIRYRCPLSPFYKKGHYGSFIGTGFENLKEYAALVEKARREKLDFVKIMVSGLMDFNHFGVLTEDPLPPEEIREMVHIAHEEGFAVMAHANGISALAAAQAGVDSIEHGAYLPPEALCAMAENHTVWVPTLSTVANPRQTTRFDTPNLTAILESTMENLSRFAQMGGLVAPGTDAGAFAVPHGCDTEAGLLRQCLGPTADAILTRGTEAIQAAF